MPFRHYQLFKVSLASEAVLPDNLIGLFLSTTLSLVPSTPLPTLCIGMGYGNNVCPLVTAH